MPSLALLPPLPRLPGPLDPTLGKGLETESPNPSHNSVSSCNGGKERQRAPCHVGFGSGLGAAAGAQRCPRARPAHELRASRPAQGGMRALLSPSVANATGCVRDPLPQKGFLRVAAPGCSMPGHFNGVWKLQRSGGPGKWGSG